MSRYASLSRAELAAVVPDLLLLGQMIDRSGMAWCISAFGREEMEQIAIEEWAGSSPIYTRRMAGALGYAPAVAGKGDVPTIFKGLQLDIGAPPQFLDFRFTVTDPWHGAFELPFCGALADVEPMGEDYVRGMCHTIEDPTFDATAVATNPKAQVRPVHRPPRVPAGRTPVCSWTVTIDDSHPDAVGIPALEVNAASRAATLDLAPIDPSEDGAAAYDGPLLSDLDFAAFSHSALVRIADEVCLQMALLDNSFVLALRARADEAQVLGIRRKQLVGFAGIAAWRLARTLSIEPSVDGALRLIELSPVFNPEAYVTLTRDGDALRLATSPAFDDGAWVSLLDGEWVTPLQATVRALDPHFDVEVSGDAAAGGLLIHVVERAEPAAEADEVAVVRFSGGPEFMPERRTPLPIVAVG